MSWLWLVAVLAAWAEGMAPSSPDVPPSGGPGEALVLPAARGIERVVLPEVREQTLPGGAALWVVDRPADPLVALELVLMLPPDRVDPDMELALRLLPSMVDRGARGTPRGGLDGWLEPMGASVLLASTLTGLRLSLLAPPERFDEALEGVAGALGEPAFEGGALRYQREELVRAEARLACSATGKLRAEERAALYPADHLLAGRPLDLSGFGRAALMAQHRRLLDQGGAVVVLSGPVDAELEASVRARLGFLGSPAERPGLTPARTPQGAHRVVLVDDPEARQVRVQVTWPVPDTLSWAEAQLVADLLGGGATARLDRRLREELGLVYEARARLVREPGYALLRVTTRLDGRDPGPGLAALHAELVGLGSFDAAELQRARATRLFAVALEQDSLERASSRLGGLAQVGSDPHTWQRELDALTAVDVAAVRRAAALLLAPDAATWVILGDAARVEPVLHTAGLRPLCRRSPGCGGSGGAVELACEDDGSGGPGSR